MTDLNDSRWGDYIPWCFRNPDISPTGDFGTFFERVGHRLVQMMLYSEAGSINQSQLCHRLESDSHQRFRFDRTRTAGSCDQQIEYYFKAETMLIIAEALLSKDLEVSRAIASWQDKQREKNLKRGFLGKKTAELEESERHYHDVTTKQKQIHEAHVIRTRLTVLECFLRIVKTFPEGAKAFSMLRNDIRRYLAESQIMLDISEDPILIVPMDEKLLQREVLDNLLPRLSKRFPDRARDLVKAYHDIGQGIDSNTVFGNAFKALEQIARELTQNNELMLNDAAKVRKAFPKLHGTIYKTIVELANQRGDKGGHGRIGPGSYEIRYLLFSICNIALLMLEHPDYAR